jgi:hypothetical protein
MSTDEMTTDEVSILTKWPLTDELSTDEKTTDEVSTDEKTGSVYNCIQRCGVWTKNGKKILQQVICIKHTNKQKKAILNWSKIFIEGSFTFLPFTNDF